MQQIAVERLCLKANCKKEKGEEFIAINITDTKIGLDENLFDSEAVSVKRLKTGLLTL